MAKKVSTVEHIVHIQTAGKSKRVEKHHLDPGQFKELVKKGPEKYLMMPRFKGAKVVGHTTHTYYDDGSVTKVHTPHLRKSGQDSALLGFGKSGGHAGFGSTKGA